MIQPSPRGLKRKGGAVEIPAACIWGSLNYQHISGGIRRKGVTDRTLPQLPAKAVGQGMSGFLHSLYSYTIFFRNSRDPDRRRESWGRQGHSPTDPRKHGEALTWQGQPF